MPPPVSQPSSLRSGARRLGRDGTTKDTKDTKTSLGMTGKWPNGTNFWGVWACSGV
jgi:hypothetical protein